MGVFRLRVPMRGSGVVLLALVAMAMPCQAQVRFDDCKPIAAGGVTCDTVPYGNTRLQMLDGEYQLLDQASPGWAEYDPYEGYEDMLGGNQT
jgi:hypothetical protein